MTQKALFAAAMMLAAGTACAQNIFNIQQPQPRVVAPARGPAAPVPAPMPQYQPATPPAASSAPVISADPKVLAQFDRMPNESDDAFNARMKVVYQRASADMERATRAHLEKMRALSAGR